MSLPIVDYSNSISCTISEILFHWIMYKAQTLSQMFDISLLLCFLNSTQCVIIIGNHRLLWYNFGINRYKVALCTNVSNLLHVRRCARPPHLYGDYLHKLCETLLDKNQLTNQIAETAMKINNKRW